MTWAANNSGALMPASRPIIALTEWPTNTTGPSADCTDHVDQVVGMALQRAVFVAVVGGQVRCAAARQVVGDRAEALAVTGREQPPHALVATKSMGEDHRARTVAGDGNVVALMDGHRGAFCAGEIAREDRTGRLFGP